MKVLLLPVNIASDLSHKVRALKKIGVEARGLSFGEHPIQTAADIKLFTQVKGEYVSNRIKRLLFYKQMYDWIKWADILHWIWGFGSIPFRLDKKLVQRYDKPGVIQWVGSDIRIPEIDFTVNPFYKEAFFNGYEYDFESRENSLQNQRNFADVGFYPLKFIGMEQYIDNDLFPKCFRMWQSVVLSEHLPHYPNLNQRKPLLLHSPSAPVAKGTQHVLQAIDKLKPKYDFDFNLVQGMERQRALEIMSQCDVYIDQVIYGMHGSAAVEAMAFGKPVVGYINPVIGKDYPNDLPIVNANPDNIAEKLEILVRDAVLRHELGKKGRAYVEKYHDDKKIAHELVDIYTEVIRLHKTKRQKN